jgi:hypothetical protein
VAAAKCRVCEAKDDTIRAHETTIAALQELVNTQRALMVPKDQAAPTPPQYPPLAAVPLEMPRNDEVDVDELSARLAAGVDDPTVSERLLAQLQATGQLREE